ncbi:ABC-type transport system involved in multi-copper enzyme maturation permease subunit [Motilibacter peucedani]|uniref:ABC-type transport system involved in multi-copper enzyme maturation permease subunit n=1 Tax=Motilibacter peucedani TaxID=598650 RepID=A0A420XVH3_9ACTN|nr:ABC transporter permease subunit [Motilibacter peucedani]RKS84296.1 ABC-type transport system involved in multi-copper enzyme maturation permease subunit [Motilibacter peucedani]
MGASVRGCTAAEWLAVRRRPGVWVLVVVWLLLAAVFGYLFPYLTYRSGGSGGFGADDTLSPQQQLDALVPAQLVPTVVSGTPLFGGALALVLGALVGAGPYGWGTLKTALTAGPRRWQLAAGQLAVVGGLVALLVVGAFAIGGTTSTVIAATEDASTAWPGAGELLRGAAACWLVLALWASAGYALGTLLRGTALAVGLGLVWALVVESLVRGVGRALDPVEAVDKALPGANAGSLVRALGAAAENRPGGTPGVNELVGGATATAVCCAYLLGFLALAVGLLVRRDVS